MLLKLYASAIILVSTTLAACGSDSASMPTDRAAQSDILSQSPDVEWTLTDAGVCMSSIWPPIYLPCTLDEHPCGGQSTCRSCNAALGLWRMMPVWGCVCASETVNGSTGLYWQCPSVPVCTLGPDTFSDSQCTQPAITDAGISDAAAVAEDVSAISETGADRAILVEAGGCSWPEKLTPVSDGSAVGCWAHAVSGPVDASQITCSSAEYALGCVGEWPYSADGGYTHVTIPEPDPSLGCRILPIPTPVNASYYCCPCGQGP